MTKQPRQLRVLTLALGCLVVVLPAFLCGCKSAGDIEAARDPMRRARFDVEASLKGDTLEVSLDTDLPDDTAIVVSVHRKYREKGNASDYAIDYFSARSTAGKWQGVRPIDVDNYRALIRFQKIHEVLAEADIVGEIESISDNLTIRFTTPISRPNHKSDPRIAAAESSLRYPLDSILYPKPRPKSAEQKAREMFESAQWILGPDRYWSSPPYYLTHEAYMILRKIVEDYPGTRAAKAAAPEIKKHGWYRRR